MIKRIIIAAFCLLPACVWADNDNPIKWSFALSAKEIHIGDTVEVVATAEIIPDWYLYSNDFDPNLGPTVTTFDFTADQGYSLLGKPKAVKPKKKYSDIWEGDVTYFTGHAEFRQKIVVLSAAPKIAFSVNFQTCNDVIGRCIPGDEEFVFTGLTILPAKKSTKSPADQTQQPTAADPKTGSENTTAKTNDKASLQKLEAEKAKTIQRDSKGNDVGVGYLKDFVKKYKK